MRMIINCSSFPRDGYVYRFFFLLILLLVCHLPLHVHFVFEAKRSPAIIIWYLCVCLCISLFGIQLYISRRSSRSHCIAKHTLCSTIKHFIITCENLNECEYHHFPCSITSEWDCQTLSLHDIMELKTNGWYGRNIKRDISHRFREKLKQYNK